MGANKAKQGHALPPRPYRPSPLLAKAGRRTPAEAMPTALHMGVCVGFSLLVFAIINICVTLLLPASNPYVVLVQRGTMMAMLTVTVLGTPNLGNSFTKAAQRILGVMIGGWLFYALYAACQQWWFLVICLTVWAFVLVAASFALSGREFLFPVALVTSFIVVCNFNTVQQAMTMTLVKTVAFAGGIVLYTIVSLLMFPLTATQQLLTNLGTALRDIEQLADMVLVTGVSAATPTTPAGSVQPGSKDLKDPSLDDAKGVQDVESQAADAAAATDGVPPGKQAKKGGRKQGKQLPAAQDNAAVRLAANANHKLQLVQQQLRMTKKERYVGTLGSFRCFVPTVFRKSGVLPEEEVLAVVVNAGQVLRVLTTMMSNFGTSPLAQRLPPFTSGAQGKEGTLPLVQQGVAALQDITAGLPVSGAGSYPVPIGNLQGYAEKLQQLVADTVQASSNSSSSTAQPAAGPAAALADPASAQPAPATAPVAAGRWQKAAVAASGIQLPGQRAQQLAAAFGALLSETAHSEERQVARWCSVLVLSRQLGRSIAGLNDSVNALLAKVPWMHGGALL